MTPIKCPKCSEIINYLDNYQSGEKKFLFTIGVSGSSEYEEIAFIENYNTNDYECPICKEVIATTEEKAISILKGE